jgi:hypothetical protein
MIEQHPITLPPELVQQWFNDWNNTDGYGYDSHIYIATRAAQWGADQELEACCEYVYERFKLTTMACIAQNLRAARRSKPPSLKEQALAQLNLMTQKAYARNFAGFQTDTIRRALEQLSDD